MLYFLSVCTKWPCYGMRVSSKESLHFTQLVTGWAREVRQERWEKVRKTLSPGVGGDSKVQKGRRRGKEITSCRNNPQLIQHSDLNYFDLLVSHCAEFSKNSEHTEIQVKVPWNDSSFNKSSLKRIPPKESWRLEILKLLLWLWFWPSRAAEMQIQSILLSTQEMFLMINVHIDFLLIS